MKLPTSSRITWSPARDTKQFGFTALLAAGASAALACGLLMPPAAGATEPPVADPSVSTAPAATSEPEPAATSPASAVPTTSSATAADGEDPDVSEPAPLSPESAESLAAKLEQGGAYMGAGVARHSGGVRSSTQSEESMTLNAQAYNTWRPEGIQGLDVSGWQENVNWTAQFDLGGRFAYVKASEGYTYSNAWFSSQYTGSRNAGMIRGAYHFAIPSVSSAATQARYFVANGGGWSADGMTLPPLLDIEYNPYPELGNSCYNMSQTQMVNWVREFSNTMVSLTGRKPAIYTTTDWWTTCTGNNSGFGDHPLHLARYSTSPGILPAGWAGYSFWQYSATGPFVGDSNVWNGTYSQLKSLAYGRPLSTGETAISDLAASMPLGAVGSNIICGIRDNGCYQSFRGGEIFWSPSTPAATSRAGAIRSLYRSLGAENGTLGFPVSGEQCGLKDGGCYQMFQGGAIMWSYATGAHVSKYGAIRDAYSQSRFENGVLGYPTGGEVCGLKDGGCYQPFQSGHIHWSAKTGAQITRWGAIASSWAATGYENGILGYPTGMETCGLRNNGCSQNFQNGQIHWTPTTFAQVTRGGAIRSHWVANRSENGILGYPTSGENCGLKSGGCYQSFEGGQVHWSSSTGAHPTRNGAIRGEWASSGYEQGVLGYPTSPEMCVLKDNGCYQTFQGGQIHWSPATGAHLTRAGAISSHWASTGWENGPFGYPTGREACNSTSECAQPFQHGTIVWTASSGISRR